ncbi:MAG: hypothetical protein ACI9I0_002740, partial [Rhodoferax sp.]
AGQSRLHPRQRGTRHNDCGTGVIQTLSDGQANAPGEPVTMTVLPERLMIIKISVN